MPAMQAHILTMHVVTVFGTVNIAADVKQL